MCNSSCNLFVASLLLWWCVQRHLLKCGHLLTDVSRCIEAMIKTHGRAQGVGFLTTVYWKCLFLQ